MGQQDWLCDSDDRTRSSIKEHAEEVGLCQYYDCRHHRSWFTTRYRNNFTTPFLDENPQLCLSQSPAL